MHKPYVIQQVWRVKSNHRSGHKCPRFKARYCPHCGFRAIDSGPQGGTWVWYPRTWCPSCRKGYGEE